MKKQRISELDFLRTIAFLAVVLQHVLGAYIRRDILQWEKVGLSGLFFATKFAVPTFVFVSGIVLFYNYYEKLHYRRFILKRIKDILIPYIIWSGLYYFYYTPANNRNIWGLIKSIALGEAGYHLWYVVMIFQFYLFLPFYIAIIKGIAKYVTTKNGRIMVFGVFTLLYMLYILIPSYLIPNGLFKPKYPLIRFLFIDYITRNSISYVYYFVLGAVVALNLDAFRILIKRYTTVIIALFISGFMALEALFYNNTLDTGMVNISYPSFFKPHYFLFTVICILALYRLSLSKWLNFNRLSLSFRFIGDNSYQAYLAHAYAINYVAGFVYAINTTFNPLIYILIYAGSTITAILAAYLIGFAKDKIKALLNG